MVIAIAKVAAEEERWVQNVDTRTSSNELIIRESGDKSKAGEAHIRWASKTGPRAGRPREAYSQAVKRIWVGRLYPIRMGACPCRPVGLCALYLQFISTLCTAYPHLQHDRLLLVIANIPRYLYTANSVQQQQQQPLVPNHHTTPTRLT